MNRPDIEKYFADVGSNIKRLSFVNDFIARENGVNSLSLDLVNADYLAKSKAGVVLFYSPTCKHCHDIAPTFTEIAKKLGDQLFFGTVNCYDHVHKNNILSEFLEIGGVPAIKFANNGKFIDYKGGKDLKIMLANICKQYGICNYLPDTAKYVEPAKLSYMGKNGDGEEEYYRPFDDTSHTIATTGGKKPAKKSASKKKVAAAKKRAASKKSKH